MTFKTAIASAARTHRSMAPDTTNLRMSIIRSIMPNRTSFADRKRAALCWNGSSRESNPKRLNTHSNLRSEVASSASLFDPRLAQLKSQFLGETSMRSLLIRRAVPDVQSVKLRNIQTIIDRNNAPPPVFSTNRKHFDFRIDQIDSGFRRIVVFHALGLFSVHVFSCRVMIRTEKIRILTYWRK